MGKDLEFTKGGLLCSGEGGKPLRMEFQKKNTARCDFLAYDVRMSVHKTSITESCIMQHELSWNTA